MNRFLRYFLLYFAAALGALACVEYLLDPFGYFRSRHLRPSFLLGDRVWGDDRIAKDMVLTALRPETLIAGSSRVQRGMDVDDPRVRRFLGHSYNLGIEAATFEELDFHIRSVLARRTLRTLVLGLDMSEFFLSNTHHYGPDHYGWYVRVHDGLNELRKLRMALWSREALSAAKQVLSSPSTLTLSGVANPIASKSTIDLLGHREFSRRGELGIARYYQDKKGWGAYRQRIDSLGRLIGDVCSQGVELKLFISPVHARQILLVRAVGAWDSFLQWKIDLTIAVERARRGGCSVSLIDFSRISSVTGETFPERGDRRSSMKWYWDSSHYNFELGLLVIQTLYSGGDMSMPFGHELTADNIHREIDEERSEVKRYIDAHPEMLREQEDLLRNYSRIRPHIPKKT